MNVTPAEEQATGLTVTTVKWIGRETLDVINSVSAIIGIVGALGGVALGAWFTGRNERYKLAEPFSRQDRQARIDACVAFFAAYRRFFGYVLTEDPEVVMVPGRPAGREVVFVKGSSAFSDATAEAIGRLELLEGGPGSAISDAASQVRKCFREVAVARATQGPGPLPDDIVARAKEAEINFCRVAARELKLVANTLAAT